ncbi:NAD-dependent epimerase/dehydratase family protein [Flavobacterium cupreum]|uniref:NAD-dependent epimerase/dehydratase family protein n=1 Tax=Flavobacterium cupreum TaxID=2133766 RepID=A0A434A2T7_9FLAO|nr:NAD(P)H-binding protein [Flavobacterium cupreum]RUT68718.1 NAD-dependent epimerase/dehydratase family protein [Flavobacterium cupreum]
MKIVLTGSLGNISKPLTEELIQNGHTVTVISSTSERKSAIEALGAKAAIGTMQDVHFLSETFKGADAVYLMETLNHSTFTDPDIDIIAEIATIGQNYKQAIENSGVKRVVLLSSVGAHTNTGNGNLVMHYNVENILRELPEEVNIKIMRPVGFFTNIYRSITTIREKGIIIFNYGGDQKEPWVSPLDIAAAIAEELERPFVGREVRYIASDEVSPNEIAKVLGESIGNPELKWLKISDEELLGGMLAFGMNPQIAQGFTEMYAAQGTGALYEDFYRHKPILGKVKLADFAKEFALFYNK